MDKRWLYVVLVTIGVLVVYQYLVLAPEQERRIAAEAEQARAAAAAAERVAAQPIAPAPSPATEPIIPSQPEQLVEVKGDEYKAVFSSAGGTLRSFALTGYRDDEGREIELLDVRHPADYSLLLSFDGGTIQVPPSAIHRVVQGKPGSFSFVWTDNETIEVTKTYSLDARLFEFSVEMSLRNLGQTELRGTPVIQLAGQRRNPAPVGGMSCMSCAQQSNGRVQVPRAVPKFLVGEELVEEVDEEAMAAGRTLQGRIHWIGIDRHFFLLAAQPRDFDQDSLAHIRMRHDLMVLGQLRLPEVVLPPGGSQELKLGVFAGPKRLDLLQAAGSHLDKSIDFGWFWFLSRPMLWLMNVFYDWVGNYGLAIIFLTIVIKILLLPITQKMYRSMNRMKNIQPKIKELKDRLGEDKEAFQREQMELMRREGVNPLGGCLPMMLQMPVYIALWRALFSSVELYQAPLGGWIQDLSAPDPYWILPVALVITMFVTQKLTPTATDNAQAKMMQYTMPLFFGAMMFMFPAGLVLYILANSLLQIVHQLILARMPEPDPPVGGGGGGMGWFQRLMSRAQEQSEQAKKLKEMEEAGQRRREERARRLADRRGRGKKK